MVIAFGLPPRELDAIADSDPRLLEAMVAEYERRQWTPEMELLAGLVELQHASYRQLLALSGAKGRDIPVPLRVPRPGDEVKKPKVASGNELAAWVKGRKEG